MKSGINGHSEDKTHTNTRSNNCKVLCQDEWMLF